MSFGRRRAFWRAYTTARWRFDIAMYWFWEHVLGYKPRPHDPVGLAVLFWYTDCPICFGLRLYVLGFATAAVAFGALLLLR